MMGLVAAAGDENDRNDDEPDPVVVKKIAKAVAVHTHISLLG